jgi:tetratricopeptide (TPR) repeat protein
MSDGHLLPALSPADARLVDQACDRFEAAWKAGQRPKPQEHLSAVTEPVRSVLLRQLLLLDCEYRRRAGDDPQADDYHTRFPGDSALIEDALRETSEASDSTQMGPAASQSATPPWLGAAAAVPPQDGAAEAPTGSARYELLEEVGQGGIGLVFRGRDRLLGRELAVKVLRGDYRDNPDALQRFVREARVGSQLQHPAIVPVYEQGWFGDRRPYLTMKLVQGHTLAELLAKRADSGQDLPRLLGILEQVCQAMAYAHARGVVHRDLKPANVMVGAFGEVQVMDWGFAKILAGSLQEGAHTEVEPLLVGGLNGASQSGALMGTPAYMPPEQARGEGARIDARADVFALGAILCEILTGRPPYAGTTAEEVCGKAAEGDLDEAYARLDSCGADEALRELARRCLAAERAARPPDAGVVTRDLTAYLTSAQEQLRQAQLERAAAEARAQEAGAKAKAERHARRLTLALAAALLVGGAVAVWQAIVATRAKKDALASAASEKEAKETAQTKAAETHSVLDFVLKHIFAAARPKDQDGGLGRDVTLRDAVVAALPIVDQSFAAQPLTEARLRMTLGQSFLYLSEPKIAFEQFRRARALCTEHLGPDHPDTLESMYYLANSYAEMGEYLKALELRKETLALRQARLGSDHPDTLLSMRNLANSYADLRRDKDALKLDEEVVPLMKATFGPDHPETLSSMNNLAMDYSAIGKHREALQLHLETLAGYKATLGAEHPQTLASMNNLANSYTNLAQHEDLPVLGASTLGLLDSPLGQGPLLAASALIPGRTRFDEALKLRVAVLELAKARLGLGHRNTLKYMHNLGNTYGFLEDHAKALELHRQTLALRREHLGPNHPDTFGSEWGVAAKLLALDRGPEAIPIIDECLQRAARQTVKPNLLLLADKRLRYFEKAKDAEGCRRTAELWEGMQPTDAAGLYGAACNRAVTAKVFRSAGQPPGAGKQAEAEADQAMTWLRKAVAAGYKDVATLKSDADLDALRDRADFQKLLAELKAGE